MNFLRLICTTSKTRKKKSKCCYRHVTLIELIIAMSLTMLIMTSLAYFYRQIDYLNQETEVQQGVLFQQLYLTTRLTDVIPRALSPQSRKGDFYFYTTPSTDSATRGVNLVFSFDNGVKLDTQFSQSVIGRLFIDKSNRLCLGVWPSSNRWKEALNPPMKCEILQENISSVSYRFYIPPKKDRKKVWEQGKINVKLSDTFPQTEEGEWKTEWPAAWEQLPAAMEITLERGKEPPLVIAFPLPNSNFMVVY